MKHDFYHEIITELMQNNYSEKELTKRKRDLALKHALQLIPTNVEILMHAPLSNLEELKKKLLTKPVRSISGVAPVAIMTKPERCPHGKCTFCPGGIGSPWGDVPQSYTGHEPAAMRGIRNDYDPYLQVFNRLEQYTLLGHATDKVELIIMGGTFPAMSKEYQETFILSAFQAMNDFSEFFYEKCYKKCQGNKKNPEKVEFKKVEFNYLKFKDFFKLPGKITDAERTKSIQQKLTKLKHSRSTTLEEEQLKNETASVRCVALCIETKPDWGFFEHGQEMLRQGCTRIELGIESVYDDVLKKIHRGHSSEDSKKSIQILRDLGFKINFHYMPGLPLTDYDKDVAGMKELFSDAAYRPDMIKLYPCMVAPGTALYQEFKKGLFAPLTAQQAAERIIAFKNHVPEYCRIQRIQRDVPTKIWEAGVEMTNLRQYIHENYSFHCRCIRCREPRGKEIHWNKVIIKVQEYEASGGKEFFISAEDPECDVLIGFARLRFPSQYLRSEIIPKSALIRELHVYGAATVIGGKGNVQHRSWGKKLMKKAEEIAMQHGKIKMVVISGIGVREYYRAKLGYEKEGPYMVKMLK